ncbi:hypothetical protein FHETE_1368 [Fusarium heterosporum]|uniref:Uncharacterized protein n=1 Tax=Fusarium heterosporum TaxID=42747 RepID=A0A8H5X1L5_FUSHE|nr:hypothetical protein FHETE_1368 [Fusarium heterosporum]
MPVEKDSTFLSGEPDLAKRTDPWDTDLSFQYSAFDRPWSKSLERQQGSHPCPTHPTDDSPNDMRNGIFDGDWGQWPLPQSLGSLFEDCVLPAVNTVESGSFTEVLNIFDPLRDMLRKEDEVELQLDYRHHESLVQSNSLSSTALLEGGQIYRCNGNNGTEIEDELQQGYEDPSFQVRRRSTDEYNSIGTPLSEGDAVFAILRIRNCKNLKSANVTEKATESHQKHWKRLR